MNSLCILYVTGCPLFSHLFLICTLLSCVVNASLFSARHVHCSGSVSEWENLNVWTSGTRSEWNALGRYCVKDWIFYIWVVLRSVKLRDVWVIADASLSSDCTECTLQYSQQLLLDIWGCVLFLETRKWGTWLDCDWGNEQAGCFHACRAATGSKVLLCVLTVDAWRNSFY